MAESPKIVRADQIPDDIVTTMRLEGQVGKGVPDYPNRLAMAFGRTMIGNTLEQLAGIIEPVDRTLGMDPAKPVAKAFRDGSLIGLRVAASCVDDVDQAFFDLSLVPAPERTEDDDSLEVRHSFAAMVVNLGDRGYAWTGDMFASLLEEWEDQLVTEVRDQRFLKSGFGIPMAYLSERYRLNQEIEREVAIADMAAQLTAIEEGSFDDWDALLA